MSTLAVSLACSAMGSFKEREQEIKQRSEAKRKSDDEKKSSSGNGNIAHSPFGSGTYPSSNSSSSGGFMSDFWGWLVLAPFSYQQDDPSAHMNGDNEEWAPEERTIVPNHDLGQATVPLVRADYNYQWADGADANDFRLEAGYKLVAFHGRFTRFESPDDSLDVSQYYGVLRYGGYRPDFLPGHFEFNLGAGVAQHKVTERDTSGAITFGLKYYPVEWAGVEFRPAFYRWDEILMRDYDFSVSLGARYFQARAGYRWFWDQGVVDLQSGPYAGFSLSF